MSIDNKFPLEPQSPEELSLFDWLREICVNPRVAELTWQLYSKQFTIPENTEYYLPERFYQVRAEYIFNKISEEINQWEK